MARQRRIAVAVLIDALGWRYLDGREFLDDILPYRKPLRTVLGFSSGAIPSILTGAPPAQHGHWNLLYYDPAGSPFKLLRYLNCVLPGRLLDNRVGRKAIKEFGRRLLGLGQGFECVVSPRLLPYFNWVEKRNIYDVGGITGRPSIFDRLADGRIPYRVYSYHRYSDEQILKLASEDIQSTDARFFFLYLSEMDSFLHKSCVDPAAIDRKVLWYAEKLRSVFQAARAVDPEACFSVFSDHGMAPVHRQYDLMKDVEALGLSMPRNYLAVYDSTMARFWFFDEHARERITGCLGASGCGRILPEEELRQLGIFFPDRRFGELIFLLEPGCILARSDFNGPRWMPAGMHGYHPDDPDSDAICLTSGQPAVPVRTIADVYEHMREVTGLGADARAESRSVRPSVL
jgi:Type I phosphodiesterase / nucleotide pyrophosphatase